MACVNQLQAPDTAHRQPLASARCVHGLGHPPVGLGSSSLPRRPCLRVSASFDHEFPNTPSTPSPSSETSSSGLCLARGKGPGACCSCRGPRHTLRRWGRSTVHVANSAGPWENSNGAVREPSGANAEKGDTGADTSSREWSKNVVWEDEDHAAAGSSASGLREEKGASEQGQRRKWQVQWQKFRQAVVGVMQTIKGKRGASSGATSAGQTPELKTVISDVRRLGLSGVLFGVISLLHFHASGRLSPALDTILDTLSVIWFLFLILDMALTSSTWVAGAKAFSVLMATCPACGGVFYYSRDSFGGCMTCPKCFEEMRWDGSRFVRDRPRFSRVNFGHDAFGMEPEEPMPPKQKLLPIVDVDATVSDK